VRTVLNYGWRALVALGILTALSCASLYVQAQGGTLGDPIGGRGTFVLRTALREALTVLALLWPTLRTRWAGTRLTGALFVAYFGVHSFVTLSRTALTLPSIVTSEVATALSAHGFLIALASALTMVVTMGRMRPSPSPLESPRLHLPAGEWLWKLLLCSVAGMGIWLAEQKLAPAGLEEFYQDAGRPEQTARAVLELGRSLLLLAFVLPVIKMMKGGRWETALAVALLMAVLGGLTPVILPTELMPAPVRWSFVCGTAPGNFIYGGLAGYLFSRRPGTDPTSPYSGPEAWGVAGRLL